MSLPIPERTGHRDAVSVVSPKNLHHTSRWWTDSKGKDKPRSDTGMWAGGERSRWSWDVRDGSGWLEVSTVNSGSPVQGMRALEGIGGRHPTKLDLSLSVGVGGGSRTIGLAFLSLVTLDGSN